MSKRRNKAQSFQYFKPASAAEHAEILSPTHWHEAMNLRNTIA